MLEEIIVNVKFPIFPIKYNKLIFPNAINGTAFARVILDHARSLNPEYSRVMVIVNNSNIKSYRNSREKTIRQVNAKELWYSCNFPNKSLESFVKHWDESNEVSGILIEQPTKADFPWPEIKKTISPDKDVEGITYYNQASIINGDCKYTHPTVESVMLLLHFFYESIEGLKLVLIGRGSVGLPLGQYLIRKGASLDWINSKTSFEEKEQACRQAEIIISCAGAYTFEKGYILTPDIVSEKAFVIDVGTKFIDGKVYGDIHPEVYNKVQIAALPKNGIGKITLAILAHHIATYKFPENRITSFLI